MRYSWDKRRKTWMPKLRMTTPSSGPNIIGDIGEVRSVVDGKTYTSRSTYNTHLKDNDLREVGNDWNNASLERAVPEVPGLGEDIARAINQR